MRRAAVLLRTPAGGPLAAIALTVQLCAFWPVWRWYVERMFDGSDEPWGIAALITAIFFLLRSPRRVFGAPLAAGSRALMCSSGLVIIYCIGSGSLPPLVLAVLAVAATAFSASGFLMNRTLHGGVLGLLVLSLPLIASLQFYLGYPLRLLTAQLASHLISAAGYPVDAQGTLLLWAGELVSVDAPCSGIKMLWAGMYLNFTLACCYGLGFRSTWGAYVMSALVIFGGNVLRSCILFFPEAGILGAPDWFHNAAGITVFGFVAAGIFNINLRLARMEEAQCAA